MIVNMVSLSCDLKQDAYVYLMENGLELWLALLENAPASTPGIMSLIIKPALGRIVYMDGEYGMFMLMRRILEIISTLLFDNRGVFAELISELTKEIGGEQTNETVMNRILKVWLHVSNLTHSDEMKIMALSLCLLFSINSPPIIYRHLPTIITVIVEVLNDIIKLDDMDCYVDSLYNNRTPEEYEQSDEDDEYKTKLQLRFKRLDFQDPVHTICLKNFLENQLITLCRLKSNNQFDEIIASLRPEIDQQLREYISF